MFTELDNSVKTSIKKIKEEHYENYFIYAYNKDLNIIIYVGQYDKENILHWPRLSSR